MPPQLTTVSQAMVPRSVQTPETAPFLRSKPGDGRLLEDARTAGPRALGERHRGVDGIGLPVAGDVDRALDARDIHQRIERLHLVQPDFVGLDAEAVAERGHAPDFGEPFVGAGDGQAALAAEAGRLAGFGLQRLVKADGIARELGQRGGRAELVDEARRVPRGAAGEMPALEEDHVAPPELGQVIGDAAPDDAAADDHHLRLGR